MSGVSLPTSADLELSRESPGEKLLRKSKQQPLVPLGAALTCGALYLSSRALRNGDPRLANRMFYWRVAFQGLTVAALIGGAWYLGDTDVGGFRGTPHEMMRKKAKEREQLWIAELERIEAEAQRKKAEVEEYKRKMSSQQRPTSKEVSRDD